MEQAIRCPWAGTDDDYIAYHDFEWGVPVHDDYRLFEFLILEGAQAGLSWHTILRKRENYRRAFDAFDPTVVAVYDEERIGELLSNSGLVRNRLKINSAVRNAREFVKVQEGFGSFDRYIWDFVGGRPIVNMWESLRQIPAETVESRAISKDLKKRGFSFVGPTIIYAYMQAVGMVNDHLVSCFRHAQISHRD